MATRILIADDDPIHRRNLEAIVMRMGYRTILADGGASALSFVGQRKDIVLMLLDLSMPDMDGLTVLRRMREAGSSVPVIVLVQNDDLQPVLQAIKMGAVDFVTKPVAFERVQVSVSNVLKIDALTQEIRRARSSLKAHLTLSDMAIKSPEMERVGILARRASALDAPLLIEGEPGSGKETLARAICSGSVRWRGPFVTVDCRTLTVDNADEVFFGVSTARRDRRDGDALSSLGKLAEADGGTLFLDEVGALPRHTQIKLFAAMQSGQFETGGERTLSNARIMASNSRPLAELVDMGRFHAGLYHLLGSFAVTMPPLRNRPEDIPILLHQFMMRFVSEERMGHITGIATHALEKLKAYHWPGNVRELKNAVYRAVILCDTGELTAGDFAQIGAGSEAARSVQQSARFNLVDQDLGVTSAGLFSGIDGTGEVRTLAAAEEEMIRFAIAHYDGQISEVARRLGIGRTTLYRKLKEYGIDVASISGKGSGGEEEADITPFNRIAG
ncbi:MULTISPECIES: sigma-54-dependent transcriptional regulator [Brucella/Ochrobactrum group]|jgi:DNA-binding NtrC family response regulator|uniref:sigma-54-dependent transcriptional regulator n=1 Tax=Brucella/Ochrobactrum group TaxID=2826938 RepID=UPI000EFCB3FB|nr:MULTISPECIES: sigma-54 dependent transcriptional regulator [Brucella/Ochrobactrum group]KAB2683024.1 sigma-54-dependent Fis family transcriptional regulator [Brucella pseudintermedia]MCO7727303.1 sigma-54 dependent transcriptional regulator [Brucella intermedia]NKE74355.1 sigma-54-dependent Fis family transcriptional regulator [Ochrobactrum sp. MC-1LL]TWH04581.1 DNA-binding NtrC family response regulator [Ochrobactrum sp. J50]WPM82281.1 sigma-54 dependent transcriptional regulator [Brucella